MHKYTLISCRNTAPQKTLFRSFRMALFAIMALFLVTAQLSAKVNDEKLNISLRGAFGTGKLYWGFLSHDNRYTDFATGKTAVLNLAAMVSYKYLGVEGNLLVGGIDTLEWSDETDFGTPYDAKSEGLGYYSVFDLKLGARLFTSPCDMGYTFFYAGPRIWSTKRMESSLSVNGAVTPIQRATRKGSGKGWIVGFRDFSTISYSDSIAIAVQTGFFFGKAPVEELTRNGEGLSQTVDESLTLGGELAAGVALENVGFSITGGLRGELNITTFDDPLNPPEKQSCFGFGNLIFFVEAGLQL